MNSKNCKLKVIGTNKRTKHLEGLVFDAPNFIFSRQNSIIKIKTEEKNVTIDIKTVYFVDGEIIIEGFASEVIRESLNVGRISVKYFT